MTRTIDCDRCGTAISVGAEDVEQMAICPGCGANQRVPDEAPTARGSESREAGFNSDQFVMRRLQGFASSPIEVRNVAGEEVASFTRPVRPVRGCFTVVVAAGSFLGVLALAIGLIGGFDEDKDHGAGADPHPAVAILVGMLIFGGSIGAAMFATEVVYPSRWLVMRSAGTDRTKLLEVRRIRPYRVSRATFRVTEASTGLPAVVQRDFLKSRYEVCDPSGRPLVRLEPEVKPGDVSTASTVVTVCVAAVAAVVGALLTRVVVVPGLTRRNRCFSIWSCGGDGRADARVGRLAYVVRPTDTALIDVGHAPAPTLDRRLLLVLGAILCVD
jgi:hypothetical protein